MSLLSSLIESRSDLSELANANDTAGLVAAINQKNIQRTNHEFQTMKAIADLYGAEFTATALGALKAAGASNPLLEATYFALCSTGIDFANPLVQGTIDQLVLGGVWTEEMGATLKEMGIWNVCLAEVHLGQDAVTEDEVIEALAVFSRRTVISQVADRYNQIVTALENGTISTFAEAQTMFAVEE